MNARAWLILVPLLAATACRKNPIERLTDPYHEGVTPQSSGVFMIYDNEFKTGGGLAFIPGGASQSIDIFNHDNPVNSGVQIKYVWNGQPVAGQQLFAGFNILITPNLDTLAATAPKNLSAAGYTTMKMRIRGALSSGNTLRIEGPTDGSEGAVAAQPATQPTLTDAWQDFSFPIPAGDFSSVKIFATFSIQYAQPPRTTAAGNGGTIYVDDLRYEK
jgi:hypothetical protein